MEAMQDGCDLSCFAEGYPLVSVYYRASIPCLGTLASSRRPSLLPLAGVLKFARLVKSYEAQDPEIASLSGKLKALFLPPMTLPPHGPASGSSVAAS